MGFVSDHFAARAFHYGDFIAACPGGRGPSGAAISLDAACQAASSQGLRRALIWVQIIYVWAALHYFRAARTFRQDLYHSEVPTGTE